MSTKIASTSRSRTQSMVLAAMLCAIGILIPIIFPRVTLEPASFTLASHVPVMVSMFLSPSIAAFVSVGTTLGFLLSGTVPIVVVVRAASHIVFVLIGALLLKRDPQILDSVKKSVFFCLLIGLMHAVAEVLVVLPFYVGSSNALAAGYYSSGFMYSVVLLVGVGTFVHSIVDFFLARLLWQPLRKVVK